MNYFDLYSSYPDRTIAAAWDSQVKEADKTPWLAGTLTECGGELFARFATVTRSYAPYPAARGAPSSASLHVPASWPRSCRNTYNRAEDDCNIGWPGRWPEPLYCSHSDKELRQQPRSPSRQTILTSYRMASVPHRSDRQRQQRCGDVSRLRGGQWRGYDCPAGKRQHDAQCLYARPSANIWSPRRPASDC